MRDPTYAVYWNELDGRRFAGQMALGSSFAELAGATPDGRRSQQRILFDEIDAVDYARGWLELRRRAGPELRIGSVDGPGALRELADRLQAALTATALDFLPVRVDEALT
jgi:hypothetical protein